MVDQATSKRREEAKKSLRKITFTFELEEAKLLIATALLRGYFSHFYFFTNHVFLKDILINIWLYLYTYVKVRREKISERMRTLQKLVPGCDKVS